MRVASSPDETVGGGTRVDWRRFNGPRGNCTSLERKDRVGGPVGDRIVTAFHVFLAKIKIRAWTIRTAEKKRTSKRASKAKQDQEKAVGGRMNS